MSCISRSWLLIVAAVVALSASAAVAAPVPFPDVPPWHWAYDAVLRDQQAGLFIGYPASPSQLAVNSIMQVYDGFTHTSAPGAQAWVERFTYNRPADWPAPLVRSQVIGFTLSGVRANVSGDNATAVYTARVTTRDGRTSASQMRVQLRSNGDDWQVDYSTLAGGSALFR